MNPETAQRLSAIFDAIKAGTSPLTAQDLSEAMLVGFIPIDAPSLSPNPDLEWLAGSSGRQAGRYVGGVSYETILSTLEEKIARKQATNRKEDGK
jgi:hypothetical protein